MKKLIIKTVFGQSQTMFLDNSDEIQSVKTVEELSTGESLDFQRKIIEVRTVNGRIASFVAQFSPEIPPDSVEAIATTLLKEKPDTEETKTITIFVKTSTGKMIEFRIKNTALVAELQSMIELKLSVPLDQQRLVFEGQLLEDFRYLSDYQIRHQSTLHVVSVADFRL